MKIEQHVQRAAAEDDAYEAALDHLVDTRGYSYDEARRELGGPPYETYTSTSTARPMGRAASRQVVRRAPRRRRSGHGPQYGEEEGVGYPNGEPPYYQPYEPLSDKQREINQRGAGAARELLRRLHEPPTIGE